MYDPNELFNDAKFNIKLCEFVVIIGGQETVMTREEVIKLNPRALVEWYELRLRQKSMKK